jgi:predicted metal-dependent hydrolase
MEAAMTPNPTADEAHEIAERIMRDVYGPDERTWPNGLCNSIDNALAAALARAEAAERALEAHRESSVD